MASAPPSTSIGDLQQQVYPQQYPPSLMMDPSAASTSSIQMLPTPQFPPQCHPQMIDHMQPPLHLHMPNLPGPSAFHGVDPNMSCTPNFAHPGMPTNVYHQQPLGQLPYVSQSPTNIPSSPSGFAGPIRKRRFSTAKIQPTRIKKVMQSDEEIGRMVASIPVSIGRAMEHFAEKFLMASAAAVTGLNGRTLGPSHMKLAVMSNPHFAFLEPLFREVVVTHKQAAEISYNVSQVPQNVTANYQNHQLNSPSMPMLQNPFSHNSCGTMIPGLAYASGAIPNQMTTNSTNLHVAPIERRRVSNGKEKVELPPGEKPKRGRPRKVKKEERLIDDDLANVPTERELMPPPTMSMIPRRNGAPAGIPPKVEVEVDVDKDSLLMRPPGASLTAKMAFQRGALQRQNSQDHGDEVKNG